MASALTLANKEALDIDSFTFESYCRRCVAPGRVSAPLLAALPGNVHRACRPSVIAENASAAPIVIGCDTLGHGEWPRTHAMARRIDHTLTSDSLVAVRN